MKSRKEVMQIMDKLKFGCITDELFNKVYFNKSEDVVEFEKEILEVSNDSYIFLIKYEDIWDITGK